MFIRITQCILHEQRLIMDETNKLTTFVLDGTTLNIVDPTALSSATSATNNANTALSTAQTAEQKATTVTHSIS